MSGLHTIMHLELPTDICTNKIDAVFISGLGLVFFFFESFSQTSSGRVDSKSEKGKSQKCK